MSPASLNKEKYKVKEIIQSYLSLEKRGRNYWAICPFHDDNRASLSISEEKNIFKCFSCGVAGDAITFIMRKENLNLTEALFKAHEILKLPTEELKKFKKEKPEEELKKKLLKFNTFLLDFYERSLLSPLGKEALLYLQEERKLTQEIIKKYKLGYAPAGNEILKTIDSLKKVSPEFQFLDTDFLTQTGLFNAKENSCIPAFKNKIVIPIFSQEGEVLSFSARALPGAPKDEPRYLHSRETLLFRKSKLLYNLPALKQVSKDSFIYLFEGFFDVFTADTIAPNKPYLAILGSELSSDVLNLLSKLQSKKIVIALDNDEAGKAAALKIFKKLIGFGFSPYALPLQLSLGKDLSEIFSKDSSLILPEPISFTEWMQSNWQEFFSSTGNPKNIFSINQLVISFLQSIFLISSNGRQIYLTKNISHEDALNVVENIFQLFSSLKLTEKEEKAISNFKARYIEAINLSTLSKNQLEHQLFEEDLTDSKTTNSLISAYSSILEIWSKLIEFNSTSIFLQTRRNQWESQLLKKYFEHLKLTLQAEEQSLIQQLISNIEHLSERLTSMKSPNSPEESSKEIFNFLELYYSLIHQLLDKYEETIKQGPDLEIQLKMQIWDEITDDRKELITQSRKTFQYLVEWEKNIK